MKIPAIHSISIFLIFLMLLSCQKEQEPVFDSPNDQLKNILIHHSTTPWYPRVIDTINGGYYSTYSFDWEKQANQNKFIVTQSRHIWSLSKLYEFFPDSSKYKNFAEHGFQFIKTHMWDDDYGGFFQLVDSTGQVPEGEYSLEKRAYGNSFAIYALSAFYKISKNEEALELAKDAFSWFDHAAYDTVHGGYFQYLYQNGDIIPRSVLSDGYSAGDKVLVGLKDYNSSIHILEAFTELYSVWPDKLLKIRLLEMYEVVSGTMMDERGFLKLHFYPDWKLVPDEELTKLAGEGSFYTNHITFGHDVETAFLLIEAADVLGLEITEVKQLAKKIVDHSLDNGWDQEQGGFYEQGKFVDGSMKITDRNKNWWAQAEGMNSLLLMHQYFPDDPQNYYENFELILKYIDKNLIDHQNTGWYSFGIDHSPKYATAHKAQIWKGNYHTVRSLLHCIKMLEKEH